MGGVTEVETQDQPALYGGIADAVLAGAVELAREAALATADGAVGEHLGAVAEGDLLVMHRFASTLPGYVGWYWAVSLVRAPDADFATVADVVQLPGAEALLAPAWVPWQERLRPGDLNPGDLLPPDPDDIRLVPAYVLSDDPRVEAVAFELGMGRERVMSRDGRLDAAERWLDGDFGPDTPMARQAPARCGTCGFYLPLAGSLQAGFGACGNEIASADGRVVSAEYGCGAHSQVKVKVVLLSEPIGDVYDDGDDVTFVVNESADASFAAVPGDEQEPDQPENEAVETGPEPDAMAVIVEPAEEAETENGEDEPDGGSD